METYLIDASGEYIDLSHSVKFMEHASNKNAQTDFILNEINTKNLYGEFFRNVENGIVLDIGANIGLFSISIASISKQIYSIEPTPSHIEVFNDIKSIYSVENISIHNCAISDTDGELQFSLTDNSTQNSIAEYGNAYDTKISVQSYKLKSFFEKNNISHIDFMKMDIEGSEKKVFEDITTPEVFPKIKSLYVELHPHPVMDFNFIISLLQSGGYNVNTITKNNTLNALYAEKNI